jgi:hypothetical protein
MEIMAQQLGSNTLAPIIAKQLGVDEQTARKAVQIGLPLIIAGLAKNAQNPGGADALGGALERDHNGSRWEDLGGYVQRGGDLAEGNAILEHILGGDRYHVEKGLSSETGLDPNLLTKVLPLLAPLVLAYLGQKKRSEKMSGDDLSGFLTEERSYIEQHGSLPRVQPVAPQQPQGSTAGDLMESMLDRDGDGSVTDDAARIGMGFLGKLLKGRER